MVTIYAVVFCLYGNACEIVQRSPDEMACRQQAVWWTDHGGMSRGRFTCHSLTKPAWEEVR